MEVPVKAYVKLELRAVIQFLALKGETTLYTPLTSPQAIIIFFPLWKNSLGGVRFTNDDELVEYVKTYFQKLPTTFYEEGILKLVKRYDKRLNRLGQYVEK